MYREIWSAEDCLLNHHIHWHLALLYLAKGRTKDALAEFDNGIHKVSKKFPSVESPTCVCVRVCVCNSPLPTLSP